MPIRALFALALLSLSSAALAQDPAGPRMGAHGLALPASFEGTLPCADCEGIAYHLDLWPDQAYHLSREWLGKDRAEAEIGRWHADPARQAIILRAGGEEAIGFEIKGPDRLRLLGTDLAPVVSDLPHELTGLGRIEPTEIALPLRGELRYFADAAIFTECLTGRKYPVAMEGDWLAAERALLESGRNVEGVFASFDGRLAPRPKMEGEGTETAAIVERFVALWPDLSCERARADSSLTNTYWKLVRLGSQPVEAEAGRQEPHLLLRTGEARFSATVGCNRMMGGYEVEGAKLGFMAGAMTRMACPPPLDALEQGFVMALGETAEYRIAGPVMEFLDASGQPVALFEAVYLP